MSNLITALIVGVGFVTGAFVAVIFGRQIVRRLQVSQDDRDRIITAWSEVENHIRSQDDTHWRMAIIKADAVLDMALRIKAFPGRSLNDRLHFAIHKYQQLRRVRWAHALRNTLAHEPTRQLAHKEAARAITQFRAALRELGML
jgi:hypothetical protein